MNPLVQRIATLELELAQLTDTAKRLSETVADLRNEVMHEDEVTTAEPVNPPLAQLTFPPPIPDTKEPGQAPVMIEEASAPKLEVQDSMTREEVSNLEMHLGRVWSVRLGIVLLTTGFVFLSRYTYDSFIRDLGPGVRLTMMYLLSFLLTGAGLVCERWKENLKNYGRIVAAGGLAAIYYCGFAAHNVEALKVIESPVTASLVLLVSAASFCLMSLWRKSRVMLSTSLALAFYSTSVNPIGWMACLSALILAAFGIGMMIRYRWVEVGFLVLVGSYLSYTWWQFAVGQGVSSVSHWFLLGYWLLFAAASLVPKRELNEDQHLLFTSLNNGAFFLLFSFRMETGEWMNQHWLFCFIFGGVLIAISAFSKNLFPERSRVVHLVKGSGLITLGLALLLDGHQLFVALLIEAIVLITIHSKFPHPFTRAASWAVGILSCTALAGVVPAEIHPGIWLFGIVSWLGFGTLDGWGQRNDDDHQLKGGGIIAALIALLLFLFGYMINWSPLDRAITLAIIGTVTCVLILVKPLRTFILEILLVFTAVGLLAMAALFAVPEIAFSTCLLALTLALINTASLSIASLRVEKNEEKEGLHFFVAVYLAIAMGFVWHALRLSELTATPKLIVILAIPILGTLIAKRTGLIAHSLVPFLMYYAVISFDILAPIPLFVGFAMTATHLVIMKNNRSLLFHDVLTILLLVFSAVFWGLWIVDTFDHPGLPLTLTSIALLLASGYFGRIQSLVLAAPFYCIGIAMAFLQGGSFEIYLCLAGPLVLHLVRSFKKSESHYQPMAVVSLLVLWAQLTRDASAIPLAAAWAISGTVLLLTGLALKSRCFRLIGLVILACSLGHLMLIDLIKLDPLPRILSFMTLGLGLLGLGFVYNRWQDRLKQIL